jgi:hypothetical protein
MIHELFFALTVLRSVCKADTNNFPFPYFFDMQGCVCTSFASVDHFMNFFVNIRIRTHKLPLQPGAPLPNRQLLLLSHPFIWPSHPFIWLSQ